MAQHSILRVSANRRGVAQGRAWWPLSLVLVALTCPSVLLLTAGPASAAQTFQLGPNSGPPGTTVRVTGNGATCALDEPGYPKPMMAIHWDVDTIVVEPFAPLPVLDLTFKVPAAASPGAHTVEIACWYRLGDKPFATTLRTLPFTVPPDGPVATAPPGPGPGLPTASSTTSSTSSTATTTTAPGPTSSVATTAAPAPPTTTAPPTADPGSPALPPASMPPSGAPGGTGGSSTPNREAGNTGGDREAASREVRPIGKPRHTRAAFAEALPDPTEVSYDVPVAVRHLFLAGLLVLLIGFPAELFNKTLEENYPEIRSWFRRRRQRSHPPPASHPRQFIAFALVAALLYTALDPDVGANMATFRLLIGLVCAVAITTLVFELPIGFYSRRFCRRACALRTFPGAMALAVAFVVMSRLANFQPGYLYGLIAGYAAFDGSTSEESEEGRGVVLGVLCLLVLSLGAWLAWIPVNQAAEDGAGFAVLLADAVLVAIFVAGLESLAFGLVPLRFLDGHKLAEWNRGLWVVLHVVAMFGFVHVLLDPRTDRVDMSSDASVVAMLGLFLVFGVLSVSFWGYFRFRRERTTTAMVRIGSK